MFWVGANKYLGTDGKPETHICFVFALITEALPGFFGGKKGIYFRRTREQRCKTEGNRGTNAILGNREHRTSRFGFRELENSVYFSRNRCPPGRASLGGAADFISPRLGWWGSFLRSELGAVGWSSWYYFSWAWVVGLFFTIRARSSWMEQLILFFLGLGCGALFYDRS